MNICKNLLFMAVVFLFLGCNAQQKKTYWKAINVPRVSGKQMTGITLSYMDMIANMRIYLITDKDSLVFSYPEEKKMKLTRLKSLTNCRLKTTGELLDSVYSVNVEQDTLRIKFKYIGTDVDNLFEVNLVEVGRDEYFKEVEKLKKERKESLDKIKTLDVSSFDLSILKPGYFNKEDLQSINPIILAQQLCDVENISKGSADDFAFKTKDQQKFTGLDFIVENLPNNQHAAKLSDVNFNGLQFIRDETDKKNLAVVLSQTSMDKKQMRKLFAFIDSKNPTAKIDSKGLPVFYEGDAKNYLNSKSISMIWRTENKVITFMINTIPLELFDKEIDNKTEAVPYSNQNSNITKAVFKQFLNQIDSSKVKLIISEEAFDKALNEVQYGSKPDIYSDYF